ncbi:hypothetical protein ACJX0J_006062, partial [Zea mays]
RRKPNNGSFTSHLWNFREKRDKIFYYQKWLACISAKLHILNLYKGPNFSMLDILFRQFATITEWSPVYERHYSEHYQVVGIMSNLYYLPREGRFGSYFEGLHFGPETMESKSEKGLEDRNKGNLQLILSAIGQRG